MREGLTSLYAELPQIDCRRLCHAYCGVIAMGRPEWRRLRRFLGREPVHIRSDDGLYLMGGPPDFTCPVLSDGLCSAHPARPMLCRLWGVVEGMECPHGCLPRPRYLTAAEGHEYLRRAGS